MKQPRFTAETLEKVIFPADENTPAQYVYTTGAGQSVTLNAQPHELTIEEQGAALCFLLSGIPAQTAQSGAQGGGESPPRIIPHWRKTG